MAEMECLTDKLGLVNCNLCGSNNARGVCFYGEIKIVKCKNCGLVYRNPRLKESMNREFYSYDYYGGYEGMEERISSCRMGMFKNVLNRLQKEISGNKINLLDVGCGQGHFMKLAKDSGWQVEGVELAQSACRYAKEKFDIEIKNKDLKEANFPEDYFDVITLWNVLDHLLDPLDTLKEIYRILKPGGILAIRIPNVNFHLFVHRLFSLFLSNIKNDKLRDPSIIVNYGFFRRSIIKMFNKAGFVRVRVLNSLPSLGDPYTTLGILGERGVNFIKKVIYLSAQLSFYITFKKCVFGSSLQIFAQK